MFCMPQTSQPDANMVCGVDSFFGNSNFFVDDRYHTGLMHQENCYRVRCMVSSSARQLHCKMKNPIPTFLPSCMWKGFSSVVDPELGLQKILDSMPSSTNGKVFGWEGDLSLRPRRATAKILVTQIIRLLLLNVL